MRLPDTAICTLLGLFAACSSPPPSPLQEVTPAQVKFVEVLGPGGSSGDIGSSHDVETFLRGLRDLEPFQTGKVSPQLEISVIMHVGEPVSLRMGPDHIGPNVPASDVVWRWRLREEAPYRIARAALEAGFDDAGAAEQSVAPDEARD